MIMLHYFVNVPKIPIIKMKNKKHLFVQYSTFMLICVVLKLVAVISKVSVSRRLALNDIQQILLIDIKRLCSPVLFSYQGDGVYVCGRFCRCLHTFCRHVK